MVGVVNFRQLQEWKVFQELKVFRESGKGQKNEKDRGGGTELHEIRLVR